MPRYRVTVIVLPKDELLDPQGETVEKALRKLGLEGVQNTRVGKVVRFSIESPSPQEAREKAEEAAQKLLANPVVEKFEIEVEPPTP